MAPWALCVSPEADESQGLSLPQVKLYMASRDAARRKRAMIELYKTDFSTVIDHAPDRELMSLLLKGLSDPTATVRLVALRTTFSQMERVARCADADTLERIVDRLCADNNTEVVDADAGRTSVRIEALTTLQRKAGKWYNWAGM